MEIIGEKFKFAVKKQSGDRTTLWRKENAIIFLHAINYREN
jgi:hypothetical protein